VNISIDRLIPHSLNKGIYGNEDIQELADSIKKSNFIKPLIINQSNVIISGHRRYYACLFLKINELPCEILTFKDENEELERLLLENQNREKTNHQKMKEIEAWEGIERDKARARQGIAGSINLGLVRDRGLQLGEISTEYTFPQINGSNQQDISGKSCDILAERVGLGSGRTYERAKSAVKKIDEFKEQGNIKDAEFLITILNGNVRGAKDLSDLQSLDVISNELKDKVINKEVSVQKAIQAIRKNLGIVNDGMKGSEKDKKEEEKVCSKCGKSKILLEFYIGRAECRDCHNNPVEKKIDIFKGVDMYALEADIKNPNKSVDDYDYETIVMEIEAAINSFICSVSRYANSIETYKDIDLINKTSLLKSIDNIEITTNKLKNKLY